MAYLMHLLRKPWLIGITGLIFVFILSIDWFELTQVSDTQRTLTALQNQKEDLLAKKMVSAKPQMTLTQRMLLNPSQVAFDLARLCDKSGLVIAQIQLGKTTQKMTHDSFMVSLHLAGEYESLVTFINLLNQFNWIIDWETLKIKYTNHPKNLSTLDITVKLAIFYYTQTDHQKKPLPNSLKNSLNSPFTLRQFVGQLTENQQKFGIVSV